jgi:purine-binding chemotaxis protein CheW
MQTASHLLVFTLESQQYALRLSSVERILRAAAVTLLPKAPEFVMGIVNLHGRAIPAIDLRRRLGLPLRGLELSDRFIVAHTRRLCVILVVDSVVGVTDYEANEVTPARSMLPRVTSVEGVACCADGLIFIHNLDTFLSLEEERAVTRALLSA